MKFGNRVRETTTSTGTGTLNLAGAVSGFRAFDDEFSSADTGIGYLIVDDFDNPTQYEVGKGTFTAGSPATLARDSIEASSNSDAPVDWAAGTKTVIAAPTAADLERLAGDGPWGAKSASTRSVTVTGAVLTSDDGKLILADGSGNSPAGLTLTLPRCAVAGDGFVVEVMNTGASGSVILDGNGTETLNGRLRMTISTQWTRIRLRTNGVKWFASQSGGAAPALFAKDALTGFLSEVDSVSARDFNIGPGTCRDSTNTRTLVFPGMSKDIRLAWASGDGSGGVFDILDLSALDDYHVFVIWNDDGDIDAGFSQNLDASDRPAGYTYYRRVRHVVTDSGTDLRRHIQHGDHIVYLEPESIIPAGSPGIGASEKNFDADLPWGIHSLAEVYFSINHGATSWTRFYSGDQSDFFVDGENAQAGVAASSTISTGQAWVLGGKTPQEQIAAHQSVDTGTDSEITLNSYIDRRGKQGGG